jgi:hypothetical protein
MLEDRRLFKRTTSGWLRFKLIFEAEGGTFVFSYLIIDERYNHGTMANRANQARSRKRAGGSKDSTACTATFAFGDARERSANPNDRLL